MRIYRQYQPSSAEGQNPIVCVHSETTRCHYDTESIETFLGTAASDGLILMIYGKQYLLMSLCIVTSSSKGKGDGGLRSAPLLPNTLLLVLLIHNIPTKVHGSFVRTF